MSETSILHEYQPGEYCKDSGCPQYNNGQFANECNNCKAFIYYQWLKINGYRLLIIDQCNKPAINSSAEKHEELPT